MTQCVVNKKFRGIWSTCIVFFTSMLDLLTWGPIQVVSINFFTVLEFNMTLLRNVFLPLTNELHQWAVS